MPSTARIVVVGLALAAAGAAGWWFYLRPTPETHTPPGPADDPHAAVTSADCARCHPRQYETWHKTYHRTMTRDAAPDTVKGDFAGVTYDYQGLATKLTREGDAFYMETVDPDWALLRARAGGNSSRLPPVKHVKLKVDRTVGSHWVQEYLHRAPNGRYIRLPVLYHIAEKRWTHSNGGFLTPDTDDFWSQSRAASWNDSCLYCHNTGPSKNPVRAAGGRVVGYESTVAELGISCEACHGPGERHVRLKLSAEADPDPHIAQPAKLPVPRRDEVCGRCHGATLPKPAAWDLTTMRDPFVPGQPLTLFNHLFWSEAEQAILAGVRQGPKPPHPEPTDGRFWGDGTPLTTGLEYNGMALSACYQNGTGKMSCLSCHTMHGDDPNHLLKPGMRTNEACYQCHADYRGRLAEHTRHPADSPGSLCTNCHMPHQVYSLLSTHRSHRISVPDLESSVGTGKPHACNLCHLDKSLGWTREQLALWPNGKPRPQPKLSADEEAVSSAVLVLSKGDARSRAIVAGAFSNPAARRASGTDWFGSVLTRLIEHDRYPIVRDLAHRGMREAYGSAAVSPFDYLGTPDRRREQLRALRARFDAEPVRRPLPFLPLTKDGLPDDAVLERLRAGRHDPDLTINE